MEQGEEKATRQGFCASYWCSTYGQSKEYRVPFDNPSAIVLSPGVIPVESDSPMVRYV